MVSLNLHLRDTKKYIDFSEKRAFWCHKPKHLHFFTKNTLQRPVQHLIKCCYFEVGNLDVLQTSGISMDIDPAPFWVNLYLSKHKCDVTGNLMEEDTAQTKKVYGTFQFIDDLCALNGGRKVIQKMYPKELFGTKVRTF